MRRIRRPGASSSPSARWLSRSRQSPSQPPEPVLAVMQDAPVSSSRRPQAEAVTTKRVVRLARGGWLRVTNDDPMVQNLAETT